MKKTGGKKMSAKEVRGTLEKLGKIKFTAKDLHHQMTKNGSKVTSKQVANVLQKMEGVYRTKEPGKEITWATYVPKGGIKPARTRNAAKAASTTPRNGLVRLIEKELADGKQAIVVLTRIRKELNSLRILQ
jgi:hypothetical protein